MILQTARLTLRPWRAEDREAFAAMNADPEVAQHLGGPQARNESDARLADYVRAFEAHGFTRWAVDTSDGAFVGCVGVMPSRPDHPLAPHFEIGWRLIRSAWGNGYATEAARAALDDVFARVGLSEVLAYTTKENSRSRAVIERLGMQRDAQRDFDMQMGKVRWNGVVWVSRPPATSPLP